MEAPTILVRKAADIAQYSIDASSAKTHFGIPGTAAAACERFGALTVFNDDVLGPSMATQPRTYAYVEVITYVVDGYFRHDDTLGSDFVLQHGDVERFSFGSGAGDMVKNDSNISDLRSIVLSIDARDRVGLPSIDHRSLKRSAVGRDQTLIDVAIDTPRTQAPRCRYVSAGELPSDFRADSATASGSSRTMARTSMRFPGASALETRSWRRAMSQP